MAFHIAQIWLLNLFFMLLKRLFKGDGSRMLQLEFGRFAHNGCCVKSGVQLGFDSQQSCVSPRPSEPGTEAAG